MIAWWWLLPAVVIGFGAGWFVGLRDEVLTPQEEAERLERRDIKRRLRELRS